MSFLFVLYFHGSGQYYFLKWIYSELQPNLWSESDATIIAGKINTENLPIFREISSLKIYKSSLYNIYKK